MAPHTRRSGGADMRLRDWLFERIIGGDVSNPGSWPWAVKIEHGKECDGSIIDAEWILTAAHCLHTNPMQFVYL